MFTHRTRFSSSRATTAISSMSFAPSVVGKRGLRLFLLSRTQCALGLRVYVLAIEWQGFQCGERLQTSIRDMTPNFAAQL